MVVDRRINRQSPTWIAIEDWIAEEESKLYAKMQDYVTEVPDLYRGQGSLRTLALLKTQGLEQ